MNKNARPTVVKTIITLLLTLTTANGWSQKVWNNPGYRNEPHGFQFDVKKVEFRLR